MPGAVTTKSIKDATGTSITMRVWDESGVGSGPFSFFTVLGADGGKLAKAEDAAHTPGDEGIQLLTVRKDTAAATATTDGDYQPPITDASGRLWSHVAAIDAGSNVIGKTGIDQTTPGTTNKVFLTDINEGDYEAVAASATDQVLGPTGGTGDYISGVLIVPGTTSPGAVSLKDGSNSPDIALTLFTGGASSVSNLVPFFVPLGMKSATGSWRLTTGANVSAIAVGNFT